MAFKVDGSGTKVVVFAAGLDGCTPQTGFVDALQNHHFESFPRKLEIAAFFLRFSRVPLRHVVVTGTTDRSERLAPGSCGCGPRGGLENRLPHRR